jgi:hypothetical protein
MSSSIAPATPAGSRSMVQRPPPYSPATYHHHWLEPMLMNRFRTLGFGNTKNASHSELGRQWTPPAGSSLMRLRSRYHTPT